jgi:hypothetical protein
VNSYKITKNQGNKQVIRGKGERGKGKKKKIFQKILAQLFSVYYIIGSEQVASDKLQVSKKKPNSLITQLPAHLINQSTGNE